MKRLLSKHNLAAIFGLLLAVGTGVFLHRFIAGTGLVNASYDLLMVARGEVATDEAVVVYLDEKSYELLGQRLNAPFDRRLHARLIERLTAAGAKAIVFDIVFGDPSDPAADTAMAEAMSKSGRVVLAADKVMTAIGKSEVSLPIEPFQATAAAMGYAELIASRDLTVREHTPVDPDWFPTLNWAAAELLKAPVTQSRPVPPGPRWMNYYGRPLTLRWTSYHDALDPARTADDVFRDRAVFVGAKLLTKTAAERKDEYPSPFTNWTSEKERQKHGGWYMPGVEIQATATLNLLRGDWLSRPGYRGETALIILAGVIFGVGLVRLRPVVATATGLGAMLVVAVVTFIIFRTQLYWWAWLIVELQIALALAWSIVFNSIQLYVQKRLYEQTLSLYLSPKLVKKFSGDPNPKLLKPGAEKQMLTILFTDIANFTSISEGMDSDDLARLMNQYFQTAVSHCIHITDGTVVKYIGDAIFAFWNAPDHQSDHAARACAAALRFQDQQIQYINGQPLVTRLGLHTGVANVGNFGSTERVDYTALGENINLASRMEGLNKYLGTTLLITGTTRAELGDRFIVRFLGLFRLKGFEKAVEVYELVDEAAKGATSQPWRDSFAAGLEAYQSRRFAEAESAFHQTLKIRPDDGPAKFYLARLAELTVEPPSADWKPEIELKEK